MTNETTSRRIERKPFGRLALGVGAAATLSAILSACGQTTGKDTAPTSVPASRDAVCAAIPTPKYVEIQVNGDELAQDNSTAWSKVKSQMAQYGVGPTDGFGLALNGSNSTTQEMYKLYGAAQKEIPAHKPYSDLADVNTSNVINGEAGMDALYFGEHANVQALFHCNQ